MEEYLTNTSFIYVQLGTRCSVDEVTPSWICKENSITRKVECWFIVEFKYQEQWVRWQAQKIWWGTENSQTIDN